MLVNRNSELRVGDFYSVTGIKIGTGLYLGLYDKNHIFASGDITKRVGWVNITQIPNESLKFSKSGQVLDSKNSYLTLSFLSQNCPEILKTDFERFKSMLDRALLGGN